MPALALFPGADYINPTILFIACQIMLLLRPVGHETFYVKNLRDFFCRGILKYRDTNTVISMKTLIIKSLLTSLYQREEQHPSLAKRGKGRFFNNNALLNLWTS